MDYQYVKRQIIWEDNHFILINKPAGILVQGDKTGDLCLLDFVKAFIKERDAKPGNVFLGLIHRLDRPVSGLVMLAKTGKGLTKMSEVFRLHGVKKIYHAVTRNRFAVEAGELRHFHKKDGKNHVAKLYDKEVSGSKEAVLDYKLRIHQQGFYLWEVQLHTGRFHQIRAQFSKLGCPIVGDLKYGFPKPNHDRSICLHARAISFEHPVTGKRHEFKAPYPDYEQWRVF